MERAEGHGLLSRPLLLGAAVLVGAFLVIPTVIVVPMAFTSGDLLQFPPPGLSTRPFEALAHDQEWLDAGWTSLRVAALAIVLSVIVGTATAIALHESRFRGKTLLTALVISPIVAPLVVLAFAEFELFSRYQLVGTVTGIGLAHAVLATPYVFIAVQASLAGLDPALARAATSLGAGPGSVFRTVYVPAIAPGVLAGVLFAFVVSFDEIVIALFLQGPGATTLPVKMFTDLQYSLTPKIAAVSTVLVTAATAALFVQTVVSLRRRSIARGRPVANAREEVLPGVIG